LASLTAKMTYLFALFWTYPKSSFWKFLWFQ